MKPTVRTLIAICLMVSAGIGCAKKDNGGGGAAAPAPIAPGTGDTNPPGSGLPSDDTSFPTGGTADLFVDSKAVMDQYKGVPGNFPNADEPIIISMNVDLSPGMDNNYYGIIRLRYKEKDVNGTYVVKTSEFDTGTRPNDIKNNHWMMVQGKSVLRVFFEDRKDYFEDTAGGILLLIDKAANGKLSGKVYFHNFDPSYAPQPITIGGEHCWNVKVGPYDCRDYVDGNNNMNLASGIYPSRIKNGKAYFTRLGIFENLDSVKALEN